MTKTTKFFIVYTLLSFSILYGSDTNNKTKPTDLVSQRDNMRRQNPEQTWVFFTNPSTEQAEVVVFNRKTMELAGYFKPNCCNKELPYYQYKKSIPANFWTNIAKNKNGT